MPPLQDCTSIVLGIETSCDETSAAIVMKDAQGMGRILSNLVHSQLEEHEAFGGVVPEIAARAHVEALDDLIAGAMKQAGVCFQDLDGVAVTAGPGLIGGLLVGLMSAKAICAVHKLPFLAINHLEGHALTAGLTDNIHPPFLMLLVSGGHTQLLIVHDVGRYSRIGTTVDDALGEAFDKTAKLMGLGYPGGPHVETWARQGNTDRFSFPAPMIGRPDPHFSFSGLKTAVRQQAHTLAPLKDQDIADICAGFQQAVVRSVTNRVNRAMEIYLEQLGPNAPRHLIVAGGVAANKALRSGLEEVSVKHGFTLFAPPLDLCTDNAAMIAWAGLVRLERGLVDPLDFAARPRWPLDELAAPVIGSGANVKV